jgi:hypothetical protein
MTYLHFLVRLTLLREEAVPVVAKLLALVLDTLNKCL